MPHVITRLNKISSHATPCVNSDYDLMSTICGTPVNTHNCSPFRAHTLCAVLPQYAPVNLCFYFCFFAHASHTHTCRDTWPRRC